MKSIIKTTVIYAVVLLLTSLDKPVRFSAAHCIAIATVLYFYRELLLTFVETSKGKGFARLFCIATSRYNIMRLLQKPSRLYKKCVSECIKSITAQDSIQAICYSEYGWTVVDPLKYGYGLYLTKHTKDHSEGGKHYEHTEIL